MVIILGTIRDIWDNFRNNFLIEQFLNLVKQCPYHEHIVLLKDFRGCKKKDINGKAFLFVGNIQLFISKVRAYLISLLYHI